MSDWSRDEKPCLMVVSYPSIIGSVMKHREVEAWHWTPGMFALPVHDAPWWYTEEDLPLAYNHPGQKMKP